jgi:hypothetical protein
MAKDRNIAIHIKAIDEASKVIANVGTKALPDLAKRVATFAAGIASVATVGEVIKKAFDGALEAEQSTQKLTSALEAQKLSVSSYLPHLSAYAVSLSHVTKATDEQVKGVQQVLISVGRLSGGALDKATVATLDLAAGLGIDLNDAALKMAKAANGSVKAFGQLGVKFSETATDGEKLARVMEFIEQRFGGAAQSEVTTLAGKIDLLTKSWNELAEAIAMQATGNEQVPGALDGITAAMNLITDRVESGKLGEALGIVTKIGMALSGDVDITFWTQLVAAVDHLKMADLSNIRLAGKFPEEADAALDGLKSQMDAVIARNAKLEASTDKVREAYEKLTGVKMPRAPGTPEPPPSTVTPGPALSSVADSGRFRPASPRDTAPPKVIPIKVEVDIPKVENDWANKIYESAKKAKEEAEALQATLDRFNANTENATIAPKVAEPKTPITGASSDFVLKGIAADAKSAADLAEQLSALREAEIALTAPIHDVAESWQRVQDVLRTVADAMPDADKGAAGGVNELIQKLQIAAQVAVEANATNGADKIQASTAAAEALSAVLTAMSYLTPEQQAQLDMALGGVLAIGQAQEANAASMEAHAAQVQIGVDAATQGALGLSSLMVDAAFGVKQSWGDAIKSLLMGIAKAIIQAQILAAIKLAVGVGTGGGGAVFMAGMMSKGGVVGNKPLAASAGTVVPTVYAATGTLARAPVPMFKPRGTDTVPAMLTPGEIVIDQATSKKLLRGQVTITAGKAAGPAAKKIIGGKLGILPDDGKPGASGMASQQITIRAPKGAHGALSFADGGLVPSFAASGMVAPSFSRVPRMPAAMMMPAFVGADRDGIGRMAGRAARAATPARTAGAQPTTVSRTVNLNVTAIDAKSFEDFLTSSDALTNALRHADNRRP